MSVIQDLVAKDHADEMFTRPKTPPALTAGEISSVSYATNTKCSLTINRQGNPRFEYEIRVQEADGEPKYFRTKTLPETILGLERLVEYNVAIKTIYRKTMAASPYSADTAHTTCMGVTFNFNWDAEEIDSGETSPAKVITAVGALPGQSIVKSYTGDDRGCYLTATAGTDEISFYLYNGTSDPQNPRMLHITGYTVA